MPNATFKRTGAGKYREAKSNQRNPSSTVRNNRMPILPTNFSIQGRSTNNPQLDNFIEQLRNEWRSRNLNTESLDRFQGLLQVLQTEDGKKHAQNVMNGAKKVMKKLPYKEVVNTMSNNQNLSDLLKNLAGDGNSSELLQNMMNNPEMKKTAMDMMQEMMSDEKKMAEMTEMMSKMLNPDNK
jgi:hypothetical protein